VAGLKNAGVTSASQRSKSSGVGGSGVDVFFWKEMARLRAIKDKSREDGRWVGWGCRCQYTP
jgi:hypothetical protein